MAEDAEGADIDPNDPDSIASNPPIKAVDPKQHFQLGTNQGKWLEYDDRGVPTKNIKKKKPTKKEKDALEAEYLEAKKRYQQYLKDVEAWEQQKLDAESALEKSDKLRWAFRQVGSDKKSPIAVEEIEDLFRIMGWDHFSKKEMSTMKKVAADLVGGSDQLDLDALRVYTAEHMPVLLLEARLGAESLGTLNPEDTYSPRTWRRKLEEYDGPGLGSKAKKEKKSTKSSSPRASTSAKSPRGSRKDAEDGAMSPRSRKKKKEEEEAKKGVKSGSKSPRQSGSKSPRGDKKEKKR